MDHLQHKIRDKVEGHTINLHTDDYYRIVHPEGRSHPDRLRIYEPNRIVYIPDGDLVHHGIICCPNHTSASVEVLRII